MVQAPSRYNVYMCMYGQVNTIKMDDFLYILSLSLIIERTSKFIMNMNHVN